MKLKTQLKWRLNELLALRELPEGGDEWRERFKALCADFTPICAKEIMSAKPGNELYPLARKRKLWATLGYVFIVIFLVTVAAFVLSYWLISDHRAPWLGKSTLFVLLAGAAVGIGAMLLSASRVTALQNGHIRDAVNTVLTEYDTLPAEEASSIVHILGQRLDPKKGLSPEMTCGCCACGALLTSEDFRETDPMEECCPRCGAQYQLVYGTREAPLDEDVIHRLRSYLNT